MKHFYSTRSVASWLLLLAVALCALPSQVAAQVSFRDDFDYPAGNLYKQGGWVRYGGNDADPIQVENKALAYAGYYENAAGKSVKLGDTASGEDLHAPFTDNEDGIKSGNLYCSALINVQKQPKGNVYVLAFEPRTNKSVIADGTNPVELGRLFLGESDNEGEVKIGIERGGKNNIKFASAPLKLGQTYLVVMRYEINAVTKGADNVYLYVNPASFKTEPNTPSAVIDGINQSGSGLGNNGLQGIELRQGTNYSATAPVLNVASLRVSDTYAGLFESKGEDTTPAFNVSKKTFDLSYVYVGDEYSEDVVVTGANLKGDVSVVSSSSAVTVSPATLSKDDVMSGDGAKLNIKVLYTEGEQKATVTLKSEGTKDMTLNISWNGFKAQDVATLKALYDENPDDYLTYRYSGEAVVTFVDNGGEHPVYYLQDATGAIAVGDDYGSLTKTYEVGDRITGTVLGLQKSFGTLSAVAYNTILGKVLSQGNAVEPADATLAELKAAPASYIDKVVRVKGVKFKDVAEGSVFAVGMTQPVVTDGNDEAKVRIFKKTTLIGKNIPTGDVDLTGLFTSASQLIIAPRGADDVVEAASATPTFEVTPTKMDMAAGVLGKTTTVGTVHVSAKNMPAAILLELTGAGSSQFALSASSIAKGTSETDVVVTYTPANVAVHKAYLTIDCPSLPEMSQTIALSAYAIDEQNPPSVAITPQALPKFSAKVGETQDHTIEITTSGMPDYAYIKVQDAGTFRVSNTMLLKNTKNTVRVTFAPVKAGAYTNALVITALGMDDVVVPVEGVATDGTQTDPTVEGDKFVLSTDAPVALLNETFDGQERNKPLHIDGWTNSAIKGTRAWWGFSFLDTDASAGEHVAKVTAYDSKVEIGDETDAQMLLVTPALDFKNAKSKMFTFRVRGDYLLDEQTDKLELCYIDMEDGTPYVSPVGGFSMPCTKDESGEWYEYHLDLADYDLPDVFFMGFRLTCTRGRNNSATYYIDDVTYGRTDIPVIRTNVQSLAYTAQPGQDAVSDIIAVSAENLSEPIALSLGGANKSKFNLSKTQLSATGGSFTVTFNSFDEGVHEAYVKLSSRGAADKYVVLSVNNTTQSGIASIPADKGFVTVVDLTGHVVAQKADATPAEAVNGLVAGVYVVKVATDGKINTYKVQL